MDLKSIFMLVGTASTMVIQSSSAAIGVLQSLSSVSTDAAGMTDGRLTRGDKSIG